MSHLPFLGESLSKCEKTSKFCPSYKSDISLRIKGFLVIFPSFSHTLLRSQAQASIELILGILCIHD